MAYKVFLKGGRQPVVVSHPQEVYKLITKSGTLPEPIKGFPMPVYVQEAPSKSLPKLADHAVAKPAVAPDPEASDPATQEPAQAEEPAAEELDIRFDESDRFPEDPKVSWLQRILKG